MPMMKYDTDIITGADSYADADTDAGADKRYRESHLCYCLYVNRKSYYCTLT